MIENYTQENSGLKEKKVFELYRSHQKELKLMCVDTLTAAYLQLGQKPQTEQIVLMAQLFFHDINCYFSGMQYNEIEFAINTGIRSGDDASCFINIRTLNIWLRNHKKQAQAQRRNNQLTQWEKHQQNMKQIGITINKIK